MLYSRDIYHGLGEREVFKTMYKLLATNNFEVASKLISYIPNIGRYDDLFVLMDTKAKNNLIDFIKNRLFDDLVNLKNKNYKEISLLAKWMPSLNCSNYEKIVLAKKIASSLGLKEKEYRKILVTLRKGRIVENNLREMDYSFNYSKLPSLALKKYREAFIRNDGERFSKYLCDLKENKVKINVSTLYPYDIINEYRYILDNPLNISLMESQWEKMKEGLPLLKNTIVVRDGSASMTSFNYHPYNVATSLAILFSELLKGKLKDSFITFSSKPQIVKFNEGMSLKEKLDYIHKFNDVSNTNILKTYKLLAEIEKGMKKEEQVDQILIISDMEFDMGSENVPTFETFKEIFKENDLKVPKVIYLNVCSRRYHTPTTIKDNNVILLSGASKNIVSILEGKNDLDVLSFMEETIKPYKEKVKELLS